MLLNKRRKILKIINGSIYLNKEGRTFIYIGVYMSKIIQYYPIKNKAFPSNHAKIIKEAKKKVEVNKYI